MPKAEVEAIFRRRATSIMVLGTTSGAGKSLMVAALCRILSDMNIRAIPFKSQNMSLNSCVTEDGDEISRIQELQARAARVSPMGCMNPILLKPMGDDRSQIVAEGRPLRDIDVATYYGEFTLGEGLDIVRRNLEIVRSLGDAVVIEGAGSPAEVNIYDRDISNMRVAAMADAPCVLVVNIEAGGAFAHVVGTLALLPEPDRQRVMGIIINNMRGDPECLSPGIERVEAMTGVPVLGVVPHVELNLPDEDSMGIAARSGDGPYVAVIRLPRISNFTDLDALAMEGASIHFVTSPEELEKADMIVIPGTKNTVADLAWLRITGLAEAIVSLRGRVPILGICGGYQMIGSRVEDPLGLEGTAGDHIGLGLLNAVTRFQKYGKRTVQVTGIHLSTGSPVRGYEIHMADTEIGGHEPLFLLGDGERRHPEGACSEDMVFGTYVHGCLDLPGFRRHLLSLCGKSPAGIAPPVPDEVMETSLDRLAAAVKEALDMERLLDIMGLRTCAG